MEYSKVTLEPLETPEVIFKKMVDLYLSEYGYGDLFDAYKVLLPIKPDEIGIKLFEQIENENFIQMVSNNRCPDCGCELVRKECPECYQEFRKVV